MSDNDKTTDKKEAERQRKAKALRDNLRRRKQATRKTPPPA
ncbi:hypothetical protein [Robiginitomaculum antarcticum]|nr:hypothetical protein [Robiginitomaculum antarcticum]